MNCPVCNNDLIKNYLAPRQFYCDIDDSGHRFYHYENSTRFEIEFIKPYFMIYRSEDSILTKDGYYISFDYGFTTKMEIDPFELEDWKTVYDKYMKLKAFL